jgi:hypothetical protein
MPRFFEQSRRFEQFIGCRLIVDAFKNRIRRWLFVGFGLSL